MKKKRKKSSTILGRWTLCGKPNTSGTPGPSWKIRVYAQGKP
jgi:hypothetical protein